MFFSPTSIANFLACRHLTALNQAEAAGEIKKPYFADPLLDFLIKLGQAHEQAYLTQLTEQGLTLVQIPSDGSRREAAARTIDAIRGGAEVIYQPTLLATGDDSDPVAIPTSRDPLPNPLAEGEEMMRTPTQPLLVGEEKTAPGTEFRAQRSLFDSIAVTADVKQTKEVDEAKVAWYGRADFLIRVDKPSELGAFSYEVVETKLARSTKARAIIQICFYSDLLSRLQGVVPDYMHVVLGGGAKPEKFFVQRYLAFFRKIKGDFVAAQQAQSQTYPEPVEHCRICDWSTVCDASGARTIIFLWSPISRAISGRHWSLMAPEQWRVWRDCQCLPNRKSKA